MLKRVVLGIAVLALPVSAFPQNPPRASARPNVVLIITDDIGYGDFGVYGAQDVKTPNIDNLARHGVRLTDFYAAPQCTPTRAALITGRYQQRVQLERAMGSGGAWDEQGLSATGRSLPQLLKNNGYSTALIGKWHLGYKQEFGPNAHGFDYFFGYLSGYIDYYTHTRGDGKPDLFENTTAVTDDGYMTDLITSRAVRFIEQHSRDPFFLEVTYSAAHWPFQPPDQPSRAANNGAFQGPADPVPATRKDYVAMVERADAGVGRIVRALEDTGIAGDTLVIFTNDNGGEWLSNNAPLFHRKDTLWEGGIRVPAILRWPGKLPENTICEQAGITMDLTATILAATGTPVPPDAHLEGIDLTPILAGRSPVIERTLFWRIVTPIRRQKAVRQGDLKLLLDGDDLLLFNLRSDIGERHDLAASRPELVAKLLPLLQKWEEDVDARARAK